MLAIQQEDRYRKKETPSSSPLTTTRSLPSNVDSVPVPVQDIRTSKDRVFKEPTPRTSIVAVPVVDPADRPLPALANKGPVEDDRPLPTFANKNKNKENDPFGTGQIIIEKPPVKVNDPMEAPIVTKQTKKDANQKQNKTRSTEAVQTNEQHPDLENEEVNPEEEEENIVTVPDYEYARVNRTTDFGEETGPNTKTVDPSSTFYTLFII